MAETLEAGKTQHPEEIRWAVWPQKYTPQNINGWNLKTSWWFFPTPLKNMLVKMGIFPNFRGENSKNI